MKTFRFVGLLVTVVALLAVASYADEPAGGAAAPATTKPLQLALVPPMQLVPEEQSIQGFRLNIYGRNENMSGVDIGLAHETTGDFKGVEFGILNFVHGDGRGLQFGGIYSGADKSMSGLQVGMVNRTTSMNGVQIGLANFADNMTGFQFGLWNEIKNKERLPVIPIINAAF
jgi:hypothetical protein